MTGMYLFYTKVQSFAVSFSSISRFLISDFLRFDASENAFGQLSSLVMAELIRRKSLSSNGSNILTSSWRNIII